MPPALTVISSFRNAAAYLPECIQSLQAQKFTDWECDLYNDASNDDSSAVIERLTHGDPRFTEMGYIERQGMLPILMQAVRNAEGEVCLRLDGDDFLTQPDALDKVMQHYSNGMLATYGSFRFEPASLGRCRERPPAPDPWWESPWFPAPFSFRRDIALRTFVEMPDAYIDPRSGQLWPTGGEVALFAAIVKLIGSQRIGYIPDLILAYRQHPGNESANPTLRAEQERVAEAIKAYWRNHA